tara:strand:- start:180 stop:827 length:648 start_codon:yes stop_codon:yes gene_type:complete
MKNLFVSVIMIIFSTACSLFGVGSEQQPSYKVIIKENDFEVRQYQPYIIAKTKIDADFKGAQKKGFRKLAGYIFGKNTTKSKISMTSPVIQEQVKKSEKISMTSPVLIGAEDSNNNGPWIMTFSMPSEYTLETLPVPVDKDVVLEEVPKKLVAAFRFTGFWNKKKNEYNAKKLMNWINKNRTYKAVSSYKFAGYNPPWTIPFLRRNEILIEIEKL